MRKNSSLVALLSLLVFFFIIPVCFSSWIIYDKNNNTSLNIANLKPVCYIKNGSGKTEYYSIEKALERANSGETVFVIPNTNPTIKYDCTIKSGVTLTIGGLTDFSGNYLKDSNDDYIFKDRGLTNEADANSFENSPEKRGPHENANNFVDNSETNVKKYRKNIVHLQANLTIKNKGLLNIGGRLGRETSGLSGSTSGDYCEILMYNNSSIINSGTIDCCGYIKKDKLNSNINLILNSNSTLYQPFSIVDFNGGVYTVACNQKSNPKVMPFNQWITCNVQVKQTIFYGALVYGYYDVYNSTHLSKFGITIPKGHKTGSLALIGTSNSIVNLVNDPNNSNNSGKLIIDIKTNDVKYTNLSNKKCVVSFYGKSQINKMVIPNPMPQLSGFSWLTNVQIADVDSSNFLFSMNHYWNGNIYGTLDVSTKQKIMPGCNVTVEKGGTLNINADLIILENLDETSAGKGSKYPTTYNQSANPTELRNALINNGTVNINSGANIGGKIYSKANDAFLNLTGAKNLTMVDKEGNDAVMDLPNFNLTYLPDISENARGPVQSGEAYTLTEFSKSVYVSFDNSSDIAPWKLATDLDSYTIKYHLNGGESSDVTDGMVKTYYMAKGSTISLTNVPISNPNKEHYLFAGWYLDSALTNNLNKGVTMVNGSNIEVYAKYSIRNYEITYTIQNDTGIEANIANPNTINHFDYTELGSGIKIQDATSDHEDLIMFDGWYLDESFATEKKLNGNLITECNDYNLFARFVKIRPKVTIDDPYFVNVNNTFITDEEGYLTAEDKVVILNEINKIRKDVEKSQYVTGFLLNGASINIDTQFSANTSITLSKKDKFAVSYYFDSICVKKYYLRDNTGIIESSPVVENTNINDSDDKKFYSWKYQGVAYDDQMIVKILNDNPTKNDFSFNAWWRFKLTLSVVAYPNSNYFKINGISYEVGNYVLYFYDGEKILIELTKTADALPRKETQVNLNNTEILSNYTSNVFEIGKVKSKEIIMPAQVSTIVVNRADKI